ncbi:hypothetical protein PF011_g17934 [Phytophthora fragariae]|uniref:Chromo domain-containing protein n=1 Tax=Phytophthora fragariae TaxID=53985 RepID=A0A6A3J8D6_9STRA|nr:hypothetical protein PF011_g17934 [Phytophthora fragariae]
MYADESLDITDELLEHVAAQGIILAVNELKDHRWNAATNDYEIRVSWKGLQAIEDSYEPVQSLVKEIRVLVDNYVSKAKDSMLTEYSQKLQVQRAQHQRARTNKKRRRQVAREVTGGGSQESSTNATQSMAVTSTWKRQVHRAPDEDRRLGHDSRLPLGHRTGSTTTAAAALTTEAQVPDSTSPRARRQRRSTRSKTPHKNRAS